MDNTKNISWPGWEILRVIGRGSFGAVYEIQREVFGRTEKAALKMITIPQSDEEIQELYREGYDAASITTHFKSYLEDIVREYSLMLDLKGHTNVVYCDDLRYIQHDDGIGWDIYIKMELLTPLKTMVGKTYDEQQTLRLAMDMCRALMLCQSQNIVHRDIKPENIFVSRTGDYKLGDFGVAKVSEKTASGTKIGTYEYMAPEVYKGQAYGTGADIYSLGLVLYWMMNNKRSPFLYPAGPIPTATEKETARSRRFAGEPIPAPCNGSFALQQIVRKACAYDPRDRYANAAEMLQDLWQLENGAQDTTAKTTRESDDYTQRGTGNVRQGETGQVQSGAYRQTGGVAPERVGVQGASWSSGVQTGGYQQTNVQTGGYQQTNVQTGSYQQTNAQTGGYQQTNVQTGGYQQTNVQTGGYQQTGTQTGGKKKSGKIWLIAVIAVVVLGLIGGGIALIPKLVDGVSEIFADRDTGKTAADETDFGIDKDELALLETLDYSDGSYMKVYVNGADQQVLREYYDSDGERIFRFEGEYDKNGNLAIQRVYDWQGTLLGTKQVTYNEAGDYLQEVSWAEDGSFYYRMEYTRDSDGVLTKAEYFDAEEELVDWTDYTVENGKITESHTYDSWGNLIQQGRREYRADGTLEKITANYDDGTCGVSLYNEEENLIGSEYYDAEGNPQSVYSYELNEKGWRVSAQSKTYYAGQETLGTAEYSCDSAGYSYSEKHYTGNQLDYTRQWVKDLYGNYWKDYYESASGYGWVSVCNYAGEIQEDLYYQNGVLEERTVYDYEDGFLTQRTVYDRWDQLLRKEELIYDDWGYLAEEITYGSDGTVESSRKLLYDDAGYEIGSEDTYYYDDGSFSVYTYDADWNILESYEYDAQGNQEYHTAYEYDEQGREISYCYYDETDTLWRRVEYTYDKKNQRIRTDSYDADGVLVEVTTEEYDNAGNSIRKNFYDGSMNLESYCLSVYDDAGNEMTTHYYDSTGELNSWVEYTYDENGYYLDSQWHYPE